MEVTTRDPLALPPPAVLREIEAKQEAKARELKAQKTRGQTLDTRDDAARLIQKNYRGHRTRRALQGFGLDSSTRWVEVGWQLPYFPRREDEAVWC